MNSQFLRPCTRKQRVYKLLANKINASCSSSSEEANIESKIKHLAEFSSEFPRSESFEKNLSKSFLMLSFSKQTENEGPSDEWNDPMVLELENILCKDLEFAFRGAIKKIVKLGYTEEEAQFAVFHSGSYFGMEDIETNIVESALDYFEHTKELNIQEAAVFEDLSSVLSYSVLEMVSVLREFKPDLSVVDAIWYLLICDSNLLLLTMDKVDSAFEAVILGNNNINATETGENPCGSTRACSASKRELREEKPLFFLNDNKGHRSKRVSKAKVKTLVSPVNIEEKRLASLEAALKILEDRYAKIPFDESLKKHVLKDERDIILILLLRRLIELHKENENWLKWANEKAIQVNRRLEKDENELKQLKADKDEAEKGMNGKILMDLEGMLANIKCRAECAETQTAKIEEENRMLKKSVNDKISETAVSCEAKKQSEIREQELLKRLQKEEKIKNSFLEDLKKLKAQREGIETNLNKDKARLKQEEDRKAQILKSVERIQSEREQMIDEAKKQHEVSLKELENYKKAVKEKIKQLQVEISQTKMKVEAEKAGGVHAVFEEMNENECVMCLNDEKSVVFLPCSHQVVCAKCNELHQKHGMKDCPACRTTISRRIPALFVH